MRVTEFVDDPSGELDLGEVELEMRVKHGYVMISVVHCMI